MRAFRFLAFFLAVSLAFSAPATAGFIQAMASVHFEQGKKAFDAGDFDKAIKIWTESSVENVYRNDPGYWDWLTKAYRGAKQYDKALAMAKKGLDLQPKDPNAIAELNALIALSYDDLGQYEQAISPAQAIIAAAPKEPMAYLILGRTYLGMNRFSDAETAALRSLEIKPTGDGLAVLGVAHMHMGLVKGALQNFKMGLTYDPKNANLLMGVAAAEMSLFDFTAAASASRDIAAAGGKEGPFFESVALYYGGNTDAALDKINAYLGNGANPTKESAPTFAMRALMYRAKGENDKALQDAQEAASLDKKAFAAGYALGFALLGKERPQEALAAFDDPTLEPALMPFTATHLQIGRALCYAKMGNLDKAADIYFGVAGQIDQRCAPMWQDKTALAAQFAPSLQKHLDQARKLEADGKYADCLQEYAQAMRFADGKQAEEIRAASFADAAKMPTPPELPEDARRRVVRGEALIKDGDLASAVAEFNDALRLAPYMPKLYYNAALLNGQLKKYPEAIRLMNIYLQGAPDAPDARAAKDEIIKWELEQERQNSGAK